MNSGRVPPVVVYAVSEAFSRGSALLVFPVLAHLFSPSDFGYIALIGSAAAFVALIGNGGLNNATHRFYFEPGVDAVTRSHVVTAGGTALTLMTVAITFVAAVAALLAESSVTKLVGAPVLALCIGLLCNVPAQILQYAQDVLRAQERHWVFFGIATLKTFVMYALGLTMVVFFEAGVVGYFLGAFLGQLFVLPSAIRFLRRELTWPVGFPLAGRMFRYGYPFVIAGLAQWVIASIDLWVIGYWGDVVDVGRYSVCLRLATAVTFVSTAFAQAWSPLILKLYSEGRAYRETSGRYLIALSSVLILIATAVGLFGPFALQYLVPREYEIPALPLVALAFSAAVAGTTQITVLGMVFEKRSRWIALVNWLSALWAVMVSIVATLTFGIIGTAFGALLSAATQTFLLLVITQRIHPLYFPPDSARRLIMFLAAVFLLTTALSISDAANVWRITAVIVFVLAAWTMKLLPSKSSRPNASA